MLLPDNWEFGILKLKKTNPYYPTQEMNSTERNFSDSGKKATNENMKLYK